jgi:hypothetical protein
MYRNARQVPWYANVGHQCQTETNSGVQCIFTATRVDIRTESVYACKTHADMATLQAGMKFKLIPAAERKLIRRESNGR